MLIPPLYRKHIFISALDWGYGHISRTCAIIQHLLPHNHITIFSTPAQFHIYKQLFPQLTQVTLPSYHVKFYPYHTFKNITQFLSFIFNIYQEKKFIHQYIQQHEHPDCIISDNRYGFYHPDIQSILICHQLELPIHSLKNITHTIYTKWLHQFDEIWIPDYETYSKSLAGKLSHPSYPFRNTLRYIQPLSLMQKYSLPKQIDYLFIISGTEPERIYFEELFEKYAYKIAALHSNSNVSIKIIGGIHKKHPYLLGWQSLDNVNRLIIQSRNIITRAGYSTLMDCYSIMDEQQQLYLVNSPHHPEQKYLYHHWISSQYAKPLESVLT